MQPALPPSLRRLRLGLGLVASLSVPFAPAVLAAEPETNETAASEPTLKQEETVFVKASLPYVATSSSIATKLPVDLDWTPANVAVISDPLLSEQNAKTLGDALDNVSGAHVETGAGIFDFFTLRGFDSLSSVQVLTDGAPEPEVTFYPLYNIERVEVFKGPAGFLYGSNPLSGAVNLVRRQPIPDDTFGVVSLEGGNFGTREGQADVNASLAGGKAALRINGVYRETDGFRDGKDGKLWAVNPSLTLWLSEATSLHFNVEQGSSEYQPDGGLPLVNGQLLSGISRSRSYDAASDFSEQDVSRYQVDFDHKVSDRFSLRNKLYYRDLDWQSDGTLLFGTFPTGPSSFGLVRFQTQLDDDQSVFGDQLEAVFHLDTGTIAHRLVTGVEVSRAEDTYTLTTVTLPTIIDLVSGFDLGEPSFPIQGSAGDSETTVIAPYVIDQMTLSPRVQVLAGVRYDSIDFKDDVTHTDRSDGELSPMLGVVFSPAAGTSLYANVGQSFAPASVRVVGDRDPERSRQIEVGARNEWLGGWFHTTLALFQIERENIAIPDDNGFTQQEGDQRSRGVELELAADLTPRFSVVVNYAYTDSELTRFAELIQLQAPPFFVIQDRSGNQAAFAPKHLGRVWLSKRFESGLGLGAGLRYVGQQFIAEDNAVELSGYTLFDASLSYTRGPLRFGVYGENLADEDFETRAFGSGSVIPGRGRTGSLRIDYRF